MDNGVMDNSTGTTPVQAETTTQQQTERMIPQSQVNEIVGIRAKEAAERAVEAFKRQQAQDAQSYQPVQQSQPKGLSEEDVRRLSADEFQRRSDEFTKQAQEKANAEAAQRVVKSFWEKMQPGKEKFQDFDTVVDSIGLQDFPNTVQLLAESADSSADVLYELGQNPSKLWQIDAMAQTSPHLAARELKRLADSIKANEATSQLKSSKAPLSQQRPSNTGVDSGNTLSMRDLKAKYRA